MAENRATALCYPINNGPLAGRDRAKKQYFVLYVTVFEGLIAKPYCEAKQTLSEHKAYGCPMAARV
ncbi:MAG: hypothetical protein AAFW95_06310 [Cyanobacteria bacterium J06638_6]